MVDIPEAMVVMVGMEAMAMEDMVEVMVDMEAIMVIITIIMDTIMAKHKLGNN